MVRNVAICRPTILSRLVELHFLQQLLPYMEHTRPRLALHLHLSRSHQGFLQILFLLLPICLIIILFFVLKMLGKKYKSLGQFGVIFISAVFHEHILAFSFGFFYPVMFVQFSGFGCKLTIT